MFISIRGKIKSILPNPICALSQFLIFEFHCLCLVLACVVLPCLCFLFFVLFSFIFLSLILSLLLSLLFFFRFLLLFFFLFVVSHPKPNPNPNTSSANATVEGVYPLSLPLLPLTSLRFVFCVFRLVFWVWLSLLSSLFCFFSFLGMIHSSSHPPYRSVSAKRSNTKNLRFLLYFVLSCLVLFCLL